MRVFDFSDHLRLKAIDFVLTHWHDSEVVEITNATKAQSLSSPLLRERISDTLLGYDERYNDLSDLEWRVCNDLIHPFCEMVLYGALAGFIGYPVSKTFKFKTDSFSIDWHFFNLGIKSKLSMSEFDTWHKPFLEERIDTFLKRRSDIFKEGKRRAKIYSAMKKDHIDILSKKAEFMDFDILEVVNLMSSRINSKDFSLYFYGMNDREDNIFSKVIIPLEEAYWHGVQLQNRSDIARKVFDAKKRSRQQYHLPKWGEIEWEMMNAGMNTHIKFDPIQFDINNLERIACPPNSEESFNKWIRKHDYLLKIVLDGPVYNNPPKVLKVVQNLKDNIYEFPISGGKKIRLTEEEFNNYSKHLLDKVYGSKSIEIDVHPVYKKGVIQESKELGKKTIDIVRAIIIVAALFFVASIIFKLASGLGGGVIRP